MAVDKHQQPRRGDAGLGRAPDASEGHLPGGTARNAIAHHAPGGGEQPGHLFGQQRQQRGFAAAFDPLAPDYRDGHGQMPRVGPVAGAGDYDPLDRLRRADGEAVGRLSGPARGRAGQEQQDK